MSDFVIFIIGSGVTAVVGSAVGLLVWGASQERYVSGKHVGEDLLRSAEERLGRSESPHVPGQVLPGGKARSTPLVERRRASV